MYELDNYDEMKRTDGLLLSQFADALGGARLLHANRWISDRQLIALEEDALDELAEARDELWGNYVIETSPIENNTATPEA